MVDEDDWIAKQPKWGNDVPFTYKDPKDGLDEVAGTNCRYCSEPDGGHHKQCVQNN